MSELDNALEWDDRGNLAGVENEQFTRPSQEIVDYAKVRNIRLNLWSRFVQDVIRLRIQMENNGQQLPG